MLGKLINKIKEFDNSLMEDIKKMEEKYKDEDIGEEGTDVYMYFILGMIFYWLLFAD